MGGHALGIPTQRLTPDRYNEVSSDIVTRLQLFYSLAELTIPRPNKTSHGDVDILVSGKITELDPRVVFGATVVVRNGGVTSFDYQGHQVDLIHIQNKDEFQLARLFYSLGDFGMIIGMMMKSLGLKYGYQGLSVVVESTQIKLSTDIDLIFKFMGLDGDQWQRGFNTDEQVFDFIISSRLFRHSMFKRHEDRWNHGERKALGNRPMFVAFIAYVELHAQNHTELDKLLADDITKEAVAYFDKQSEVDKVMERLDRTRRLKQRFNGHIVMEITGLKAQPLSAFIQYCRSRISDDEMLKMTPQQVREVIRGIASPFNPLLR